MFNIIFIHRVNYIAYIAYLCNVISNFLGKGMGDALVFVQRFSYLACPVWICFCKGRCKKASVPYLSIVFWLERCLVYHLMTILFMEEKIFNLMEQEDFDALEMLEIKGGQLELDYASNANCYGAYCAHCVIGCSS